ncbi:DUF4241 domain-containing protein [soil metagenome]
MIGAAIVGCVATAIGLLVWRVRHARRSHVHQFQARLAQPDLEALFRAGLHKTQSGPDDEILVVEVRRIATLYVPTGKIVCCDPLSVPDAEPLERTVPAGEYPVDVAIATPDSATSSTTPSSSDTWVAGMRVVFAEGTPVRWERADGKGYRGVGCFMDASTGTLIKRESPEIIDQLDDSWADHRPVAGRPENCVMAMSGWGDGQYNSYWGLDALDRPLQLVTDFALVA